MRPAVDAERIGATRHSVGPHGGRNFFNRAVVFSWLVPLFILVLAYPVFLSILPSRPRFPKASYPLEGSREKGRRGGAQWRLIVRVVGDGIVLVLVASFPVWPFLYVAASLVTVLYPLFSDLPPCVLVLKKVPHQGW